ncbi:MAG: VWA domain-containing protein, partial [Phycisphaerales bacterium]|nr:VWA domain-containing protein [Phycisphaerales bacterium]
MTSTNFPLVLRSGLAGVAFLGISSLAHAQNPNSCPAGLQTLTTEIIAPDFCDEDEMTCLVTACANMNVPPGKAYNICFVIDDSTTMGGTDVDIAVVNDQNNDGKIQRIDAAIQGFLALSQAIQNLNPAPPIQISMVAFAKDAAILDLGPAPGQQTWIQSLTQDADTNGIADFEEVLRSLATGGLGQQNVGKFTTHDWAPGTDYTEALNLMNQAFTTAPAFPPQYTVCNIGLFISDGLPNQTDITPKYNDAGGAVDQAAALGTIISAFGVGPDVATLCDPGQPLHFISDTTGGDCQAKDDPTELTTALANGTLAQQIDKLELFVNNVLVAT